MTQTETKEDLKIIPERYEDCVEVDACIEYLKKHMQGTYDSEDYQNVLSFLNQVSGLLLDAGNAFLTSAIKQTLRDQARYVAQYRGYTGFRHHISIDDVTNLAQLTSVIMRCPEAIHLRPPLED